MATMSDEQYRQHNMRGSDGPCMCPDCENYRYHRDRYEYEAEKLDEHRSNG